MILLMVNKNTKKITKPTPFTYQCMYRSYKSTFRLAAKILSFTLEIQWQEDINACRSYICHAES